MKDTTNTLEGIRDITPPAMPWQYAWENHALEIIIVGLLAGITLFIVLQFIWRRYFSVKGKARRKINALQRHLHANTIDSHHAAFQLSLILREGLNISQLSRRTPLPATLHTQEERWQTFITRFSVARYSRNTDTHVAELLTDAQFWLRYWPASR